MVKAEGHEDADTPTKRYRRPPAEAEIRALPDGVDSAFRLALADAVELETLVHGIRRLCRAGDEEAVQAMVGILLDLMAPRVASSARREFPRNVEDWEDLVQEVSHRIVEKVLDTTDKEWFWEANFGVATARLCTSLARPIRNRREHERQFDRHDGDGEPIEDTLVDPRAVDPGDFVVDKLATDEVLRCLDGNVRRAVYLKAEGFKTGSGDPDEVTIASILGVTSRTVRNYLAQARDTLSDYSGR